MSRACLRLALALCALAAAGCSIVPAPQADPTRFYLLPSATPAADAAGTPETAAPAPVIGLLRVELSEYLRSPSLLVRRGEAEVKPVSFARWAEPLDAGLARALFENLAAAPAGRVLGYPFPGDVHRDHDVRVHVLRCEGDASDRTASPVARFTATWEILAADGSGQLQARGTYEAPPVPWDGEDYDALARALGDGAAGLAAALSAELARLD